MFLICSLCVLRCPMGLTHSSLDRPGLLPASNSTPLALPRTVSFRRRTCSVAQTSGPVVLFSHRLFGRLDIGLMSYFSKMLARRSFSCCEAKKRPGLPVSGFRQEVSGHCD